VTEVLAPYLVILLAGTLATEVWRWVGVVAGSRLDEDAEVLVWVRGVATALVAAFIGELIVFPSGALASAPLALRIGATAFGWIAYALAGRNVLVGVLAAEAVLIAGLLLG